MDHTYSERGGPVPLLTYAGSAFARHRSWGRHVYSERLRFNLRQRLILRPRSDQASLISRSRPVATS